MSLLVLSTAWRFHKLRICSSPQDTAVAFSGQGDLYLSLSLSFVMLLNRSGARVAGAASVSSSACILAAPGDSADRTGTLTSTRSSSLLHGITDYNWPAAVRHKGKLCASAHCQPPHNCVYQQATTTSLDAPECDIPMQAQTKRARMPCVLLFISSECA
jgi:hypothetical protein